MSPPQPVRLRYTTASIRAGPTRAQESAEPHGVAGVLDGAIWSAADVGVLESISIESGRGHGS